VVGARLQSCVFVFDRDSVRTFVFAPHLGHPGGSIRAHTLRDYHDHLWKIGTSSMIKITMTSNSKMKPRDSRNSFTINS
jgi:hypothetical protein